MVAPDRTWKVLFFSFVSFSFVFSFMSFSFVFHLLFFYSLISICYFSLIIFLNDKIAFGGFEDLKLFRSQENVTKWLYAFWKVFDIWFVAFINFLTIKFKKSVVNKVILD
jgi:hypothetical protein